MIDTTPYKGLTNQQIRERLHALNLGRFMRSLAYIIGEGDHRSFDNLRNLAGKDHWLWMGTMFKHGDRRRPFMWWKESPTDGRGKQKYAHIVAYELFRKQRRGPDQIVLRTCEEERCVCPYPPHHIMIDSRDRKSDPRIPVMQREASALNMVMSLPQPRTQEDEEALAKKLFEAEWGRDSTPASPAEHIPTEAEFLARFKK